MQETLLPLRGLARLAGEHRDDAVEHAVERTAAFLLERRLLWRRRDGAPIRPSWGSDPMLIQWPIRFYDVLAVLVVMTETGRVHDARCADALDLLASKRLPGGGFPVEARTATTSDRFVTRGTFADWGPVGRDVANPFVTVDAEWVLRSARRTAPDAVGQR